MKPLSISGVLLKRKLAGEASQSELAAYLQCDQTTISKWLTRGATPSLAMAFALEAQWPEIKASGWLTLSDEPDAFCDPYGSLRQQQLRKAVAEAPPPGRPKKRKAKRKKGGESNGSKREPRATGVP